MQFSDVIGQTEVKKNLVELVNQNRLSHALLFLGKEGSGSLPLALAFAQYITCEKVVKANNAAASLFLTEASDPSAIPFDACGVCSSCTKARDLVHPDIHYSYPVVTKKAGTPPISTDYIQEWREFLQTYPYGNVYDWLQSINAENKQGNITAQECNDIIRILSLKSFESDYKILIMWMPEYLGKEGNKLLKLIEEPPPNTLFILVAESESGILSTILSRCQLVKIPALNAPDVEQALIHRSRTTPDTAKRIANISSGNYREALQLLQHTDDDFHNLLREWLNATVRNQPIAQVKSIEEIARMGRENQKQFLRYFNHLLQQALRLSILSGKAKETHLNALTTADGDFANRLNKISTLEQQEAITHELDNAAYYIERNANSKILFHALTIKIFHIIKNNVVISV